MSLAELKVTLHKLGETVLDPMADASELIRAAIYYVQTAEALFAVYGYPGEPCKVCNPPPPAMTEDREDFAEEYARDAARESDADEVAA
jgi:hypothetical protein